MPVADGDQLRPFATAAAAVAATVAFAVYTRTLLPGVDLGDTGGFQAAVLWPETSARRAYPLYYALAAPFVRAVSASDPARGLNLFSAVCAGLAVGLLTYLAGLITRSIVAGLAAGLLLAFSYTFWTQAIIAEVYALHLALVALCLIALHAYAANPSVRRLALFFAIYAGSFGNHLTMIVLFVPCAVFLLQVQPQRRQLLRPGVVVLAAAIALAAALQYLPNLLFVWTHIDSPPAWTDRLAAFWFDTTKADWREAMVLGVSSGEHRERVAMWMWDARQQFGLAGIALAVAGGVRLWFLSRPWAVLIWLAYALSTLFAITYNVGDPHVFFLPGHFFAALAAAAALAPWWTLQGPPHGFSVGGPPHGSGIGAPRRAFQFVRGARVADALHSQRRVRSALVMTVLLYAGWRAWDTWPAVDRQRDTRAEALVARLTAGLSESDSVLLSQMNWQSENALLYTARFGRSNLAWTRVADVLPHFPFFVRDNRAIGRDVVLTADAVVDVLAAFGPLYTVVQDPLPPAPPFVEVVAGIARGTPYVLTLLTPTREVPLNVPEFEAALTALTGGHARLDHGLPYQVWAGVAGEAPLYYRGSDRPFRDSFTLTGERLTVRIDGWLPFDTFRRGGFGGVQQDRRRILVIERGASLVWLRGDSTARTVYSGSLYDAAPRFRIPAFLPQQAHGTAGAILGTATPLR